MAGKNRHKFQENVIETYMNGYCESQANVGHRRSVPFELIHQRHYAETAVVRD